MYPFPDFFDTVSLYYIEIVQKNQFVMGFLRKFYNIPRGFMLYLVVSPLRNEEILCHLKKN